MRRITVFLLLLSSFAFAVFPSEREEAINTIESFQSKVLGSPDLMKVAKAINKDAFNGKEVKLAIILNLTSQPLGKDDFVKSYEKSVSAIYQDKFIRAYELVPTFNLIERRDLEKILEEQHFSYTGILEKPTAEAGHILGATHLYIVDVEQLDSSVSHGIAMPNGVPDAARPQFAGRLLPSAPQPSPLNSSK